ncbi:polysaccharide deacetylase family protein [Streptomyces aureus]|uniref:polysaccharide deacetylase family protein n=1 Tax=Streptomyces aureus TaxID=193461 RepID=UPI0007C6DD0B|nr:polysaccharide deacetylase family protein [Streptomyces aureus]
MTAVPVFLYHSVSYDPPSWIAPFTVGPRVFAEQLETIADSGLRLVPLHRLVAAQRGGPPLPARSAVLTFDDGFADFHSIVLPLLARLGLPATLFVTTGALRGRAGAPVDPVFPPESRMLSWRQLGSLDGASGVEIGGHTRTHPQLDTLPAHRVWDEVAGCAGELEDFLGHRVTSFAYPHGYSSAAVRDQVSAAGWTSATAVRDAFSSAGDDPLRIARLMVRADTDRDRFRQWTTGAAAPVAPFPEGARTKGWRAYRRMRARLNVPYRAVS